MAIMFCSELNNSIIAPHSKMQLDVYWKVTCKLRSLTVKCNLYCDLQWLGMSRLSSLRLLEINDMRGSFGRDAETISSVDTLVSSLDAHCPNVKVLQNEPESSSNNSAASGIASASSELESSTGACDGPEVTSQSHCIPLQAA